jgi:hypothetical protein
MQRIFLLDDAGAYIGDGFLLNGIVYADYDCKQPLENPKYTDKEIPEGLFSPKQDEETGEWTEGLATEEIAERMKLQPVPPDPRDEKIAELERQNIETMLALTSVYEENLQIKASNQELTQQNIETMLALTDVYEQLLALQQGGGA